MNKERKKLGIVPTIDPEILKKLVDGGAEDLAGMVDSSLGAIEAIGGRSLGVKGGDLVGLLREDLNRGTAVTSLVERGAVLTLQFTQFLGTAVDTVNITEEKHLAFKDGAGKLIWEDPEGRLKRLVTAVLKKGDVIDAYRGPDQKGAVAGLLAQVEAVKPLMVAGAEAYRLVDRRFESWAAANAAMDLTETTAAGLIGQARVMNTQLEKAIGAEAKAVVDVQTTMAAARDASVVSRDMPTAERVKAIDAQAAYQQALGVLAKANAEIAMYDAGLSSALNSSFSLGMVRPGSGAMLGAAVAQYADVRDLVVLAAGGTMSLMGPLIEMYNQWVLNLSRQGRFEAMGRLWQAMAEARRSVSDQMDEFLKSRNEQRKRLGGK